MNVVNDLFFEILQVAIGNRDMLTHAPSAEEWEEVYEVCKKQSVTGIAFAGVERLPQEQMPPGRRIRQWAVKADKIRERNVQVSRECVQVSKFFEKNGFDSVILKGQGNYAYYPEHLQGLRGAGDIDVWCWPKANTNETQSEIATIREHGSLRYGASAYDNANDNNFSQRRDAENQGSTVSLDNNLAESKLSQDNISIPSDNSQSASLRKEQSASSKLRKDSEPAQRLNPEASAEDLNQRASASALNPLNHLEPAQRLNSLNQRAIASDLNLEPTCEASALNQREARLEHPVRAVIEFCLSVKKGEYVYYHNMDFPILKDTAVEVHYRPTWLYNPFRNRALQRWFASQVQEGSSASQVQEGSSASQVQEVQRVQERAREFKVYDEYKIPSVEFNVVFQLLHLYKHIFEEGIGLRQLLDYYFVVQKHYENETQSEIATKTKRPSDYENGSNNKDNRDNKDNIILLNSLNQRAEASDLNLLNQRSDLNSEASAEVLNQHGARLELFKKLGLEGFAGAVMYVMQEVFAMPRERMLWEPNEKRGKKLLEEIMMGGNFGKFDERYNWAETTNGSMDYRGASYAITRLRHNFQFLSDYPSEVLWEPLFRVYHWMWRKFKLWRFE